MSREDIDPFDGKPWQSVLFEYDYPGVEKNSASLPLSHRPAEGHQGSDDGRVKQLQALFCRSWRPRPMEEPSK